MRFVKQLALMAMAALAAIATTACEDPNSGQEGKNPNLNHDLTLTVDVDNITATSAKIKVTHNGKTADSWYGLLTTDTTTRIDEIVEATVNELKAGDIGPQLTFSKSYVKILTPLTPNTEYRYIAFGLSEEGEIYGEYASLEFTTLAGGSTPGGDTPGKDEVYEGMNVNPAWSIAFTGPGTIDGQSFNNIVTVNSTDNNPYTIVTVYSREYDVAKLRDLGAQLIDSFESYLDAYNSAYGTELVLNDMLYRGNGQTAFDDLDPGYYVAIALGITAEGEVSGLYAVSPTFEIEEEVPTSLYMSWLGDWTITGDNKISNDVVIGRNFANRSVNLIGLMGLPFSIVGEYSSERNDIVFYAQMVYPNYAFEDGSVANICLLGLDKEGKHYGLNNGEYGIAIAGVLEGGQRAIVRYGVNQPDYPKFVAMFLTAEVNGTYYTIGEAHKNIPAFNVMAEINPLATESAQVAAPMSYKVARKALPTPKLRLGEKIEVVNF